MDAIVNGTVIFKVRWVPQWKWMQVKEIVGKSFFGKDKVEFKYIYRKTEKAVVDLIEIEDYLQSGPDEQKRSYNIQSMYSTLPDMKTMEQDGMFLSGTVTEKINAKMDEKAKAEAAAKAPADEIDAKLDAMYKQMAASQAGDTTTVVVPDTTTTTKSNVTSDTRTIKTQEDLIPNRGSNKLTPTICQYL